MDLRVECTQFQDNPVVEWVAWFTNKGSEPTPLIRDILAINETFSGSSPALYHCNGDFYSEEGYTPCETPLPAGEAMEFAPNGGRPCNGAFPYYRIMFEDCGLSMAIGWPGQWAASFKGLADGVHVRAGQEKTNLRLMPRESIRTPRVPLLSWSGDVSGGVNLWRRWYLAHILPRPNGQSMKQHGIPFDVWWIDAGCYPCYDENGERQWPLTGTWEPDPERFPNGLKPVSDCATRNSAALLLWFEPERVHPGTKLDIEHPEWLLRSGHAPAAEAERVRVPFCRLFGSDSRRKGPFLTSHHATRRSTQRSPIDHQNGYRKERMEGK